jgi:nucleotide-binding universal stress UspA family protein
MHLFLRKEAHMPKSDKSNVVVVAVDYSETGNLALERALELGLDKPETNVHVINVLPVYQRGVAPDASSTAWTGSLPSLSDAAAELRAYVEQRLAAFRAAHPDADLSFLERVRAHQRDEGPAEQIAQLAADVEADLVVVGTHGRRGLSRLVLGSVAEATLRLAPCPVLVVRPKSLPPPVPAIQPPCPACLAARQASGGAQFWCAQHSEHHGQRHTYHQGDRASADTNLPLVVHG